MRYLRLRLKYIIWYHVLMKKLPKSIGIDQYVQSNWFQTKNISMNEIVQFCRKTISKFFELISTS